MTSNKPDLELDRIAAHALHEVLAIQFKMAVFAPSPDQSSKAAGDEHWLTGTVNLESPQMKGGVLLQMSEPWLSTLNASLGNASRDPAALRSELLDLAGELCNMVAGRIGAGLAAAGHICALSTPNVIRGRQQGAENGSGIKCSRTSWTCAGGTLTLTVWTK
jgi:CheY-specific phosphatase CheX